jgi:hypothetical protein
MSDEAMAGGFVLLAVAILVIWWVPTVRLFQKGRPFLGLLSLLTGAFFPAGLFWWYVSNRVVDLQAYHAALHRLRLYQMGLEAETELIEQLVEESKRLNAQAELLSMGMETTWEFEENIIEEEDMRGRHER